MAFNLFAPKQNQQTGGLVDWNKVGQPAVTAGLQREADAVNAVDYMMKNANIGQQKPQNQGGTWADHGVYTRSKQGGQQNQPITSMDDLAKAMGYTSPQEEERLRKASVANQRIMAVADALRHIGNIANTVKYAPSQQFNSPVQEEYARYLQGKAMRDKANHAYLTYQQQKAAQDEKRRQWEATFNYNMVKDAANAKALKDYRDATMRANEDKWKTQLGYTKERDEANRKQRQDQYDKQNAFTRQRIGIAAQNSRNAESHRQWIRQNKGAGGGGKGGTLTFRGKNGFYSKQMSANEANAFYNQAFDELSKMKGANGKPIIDKAAVSGEMIPGLFGGSKISLQARKEAVDKAIYNHPEAGRLLQDMYEFSLDPRGAQQQAAQPTYNSNIKFGSDFWNSQLQQKPSAYSSYFTPDAEEEEEAEDMLSGYDDDMFSEISI